MPARTADQAAIGAGMRQLSTAPELPAPLINPDWSINQERPDPAVLQFQLDLQSYKDHVKEYMTAKANADTASSAEAETNNEKGNAQQAPLDAPP